jgi:signal transduction histidine kinase
MAERMGDIGGQLVVRSTALEGTTVCLRLPLPAEDSGPSSRQGRPI